MSVQNAKSVRLMTQNAGQISTHTKASDVIFLDNIDLQTKYNNGQMGNSSTCGIVGISPNVKVIVNTDTEFRIQIKSIDGTIISPNLKGADADVITAEIRQMLTELRSSVDDLSGLSDSVTRLAAELTTVSRRVGSLETGLANVYTKDEVGNIVNDCVTGISVNQNNLVIEKGAGNDTVQFCSSLSDEDIESIF